MLNYGKGQSIGIKLLKVAEKNIVLKSYKYKIAGMTPDDIAQELRKKIWEKRNQYNPKKGRMTTFTNYIIRNCLKDLNRASRRNKQILNRAIPLDKVNK